MVQRRSKLGWLVVAWAAVVAQAVPAVCCGACEQPPRSADQPCRCHLAARQEQPLAPSADSLRNLTAGYQPAALAAALPTPPEAISASREYLAAWLAVPIRPPRILFGVWRL